MAIFLITGKPGSFKSAYTMQKALDYIEQGRLVYFCNFRGLQAEKYNLNTIDHFSEWINLPDGTVIFIDEVQEFTRDVPTNAKTEDLPKWFTALEKHRHRGFDIYVNTQHPMFIHTHIRRLLEKHWHLQRTEGLPFANLRMWQQICNEPEDLRNASLKAGCTTTIFKPNKKVFDYYESTVDDTHKFKIPAKLVRYILLILAGIFISTYLILPVAKKYLNFGGKEAAEIQPDQQQELLQQSKITPLSDTEVELVAKNQQLEREIEQLRNNQYETQVIKYNANDPWAELDYTYQATTQPYLAGCAVYNGRCTCYTQQATPLQIPQDKCMDYMRGNRPFNPFLQPQQASYRFVEPEAPEFTE